MMASRADLRSSFMRVVYSRASKVYSQTAKGYDPPLQMKGGAPSALSEIECSVMVRAGFGRRIGRALVLPSRLLVFLVDQAHFAFFVEHGVEGFAFAQEDIAKLFFLNDRHSLQLDHFEDREKGHDHGVARGARFEKLHEVYAGVVARQDLSAQLRHHLRHCELFVLQFDAGNFFAAFEDLLKNFDEIDE